MKVSVAVLLSFFLIDVAVSFIPSCVIRRTGVSHSTKVKAADASSDLMIEFVKAVGGNVIPTATAIFILTRNEKQSDDAIKAAKEASAAAIKAQHEISAKAEAAIFATIKAEKETSAAAIKAEKETSAKAEAAIFATIKAQEAAIFATIKAEKEIVELKLSISAANNLANEKVAASLNSSIKELKEFRQHQQNKDGPPTENKN